MDLVDDGQSFIKKPNPLLDWRFENADNQWPMGLIGLCGWLAMKEAASDPCGWFEDGIGVIDVIGNQSLRWRTGAFEVRKALLERSIVVIWVWICLSWGKGLHRLREHNRQFWHLPQELCSVTGLHMSTWVVCKWGMKCDHHIEYVHKLVTLCFWYILQCCYCPFKQESVPCLMNSSFISYLHLYAI